MPKTRVSVYDTRTIGHHAALILDAVEQSLADPETHKLAKAVISGSFDYVDDPRAGKVPAVRYHGRYYRLAMPGQQPIVCKPEDDMCAAVALWNFCVFNIRYTQDQQGADVYQDLRTTLESGAGDCDDFTTAFCALGRALGYDAVARIISEDGGDYHHVYAMVQLPSIGQWMALDPTDVGKGPGWQPGWRRKLDYSMGAG